MAEVARAIHEEDGAVTVIVGAAHQAGHHTPDYWARLGDLLDSLRAKGISCVRLVMSGAGDDQPDRPGLARRIADTWEMEVIAPDAAVLIAPGGSLFVRGNPRTARGWWRFAPGTSPRPLGPRAPVPVWQEALGRVPARTAGGCVVDQIPAGIHLRLAEAPQPGGDDLRFAMPVHPERPVLLVGTPQAEDVPGEEVAAVLAALPAAQRLRVQLAPGGRRDLLPLAQSVADMLDSDVEVLSGIPMLFGNTLGEATARPTLVGSGGEPTWQPYVTAVACRPAGGDGAAPDPHLVDSYPLAPGRTGTGDGTLPLTGPWYAVATRAGVAVAAQGGPAPSRTAVPVDPDTLLVELGTPGAVLDESVLPALSRLLDSLGPRRCARTTLLVRGTLSTGEAELRRLASRQGVSGVRYLTDVTETVSSRSGPCTASPRANPDAERPVSAAADQPAGGRTPVSVSTQSSGAGAVPGHQEHGDEGHAHSRPAPVPPGQRRHGSERHGSAAIAPAGTGGGSDRPATFTDTAASAEGAGALGSRSTVEAGGQSPVSGPREPVRTPAASAGDRGVPRADAPETSGRILAGVLPVGPGRPPSSGENSSPFRSAPTAADDQPTARGFTAGSDEGADRDDTDGGGRGASVSSGKGTEAAPQPPSDGSQPPVRTPAATGAVPPSPPPTASRVLVPLVPGHVSTDAERAAFRELASQVWEVHGAAVSRILTRMPALRGQETEAARADLVALLAYLTAEEGPLLPHALDRELRFGDGRLLPYAACIASALRRLPSYRGVVLRGGATAQAAGPEPEAGALLLVPGPVSSLALSSARPSGAPVRYAIWSVTGRKVRQLLDRPGGAKHAPEEVVFAPGSAFRVLGSRTVQGSPVLLLRELSGEAALPASATDGVEELSQLDRVALGRLEAALGQQFPTERGGDWPQRCAGPVGPDG
ncbi:hypothetical protein [Streptomyces sp. NPDC051636]|uniref:hypothetical protein n=1 Tax=Streptomyces sp. NPDC051636 TaxID=3365663 RepID=UPI0037BDABBF